MITKINPDAQLKGKSADYVLAAYDMAIATHSKSLDSSEELMRRSANATNTDGESLDSLYELERKRLCDSVEETK